MGEKKLSACQELWRVCDLQVSMDFVDAVRRLQWEIPESETESSITHSTGSMSFMFVPVSLARHVAQRWHEAAQVGAVHTVVCLTAEGPDRRKQKYFIMGRKQTYLNFAPDGDIIFIISKQTCHLFWRETQSLSSKAITALKTKSHRLFLFKILIFFNHGFFALILIFKNIAWKYYLFW